MLSTVEGQFSVQFGARFDTIHIDAADGSVTVKRVPTVFTVSDPDATVGDGNERQQRARFFGRANANIFEPVQYDTAKKNFAWKKNFQNFVVLL